MRFAGLAMVAVTVTGCVQVFGLDSIDDDEPATVRVRAVALGGNHSCALLDGGAVRCWGRNTTGQLGLGDPVVEGATRPATAVSLAFGAANGLSAGGGHTCALGGGGQVICWGNGSTGQLGTGATVIVGDDEAPGGPIAGLAASRVAAGGQFTCAAVGSGMQCWGAANYGQLATESTMQLTMPGAMVLSLASPAAGFQHACAIDGTGGVVCWGDGTDGRLGYGNEANIGDASASPLREPLNLGGVVMQVSAGLRHTCAVRVDRVGGCWGDNRVGQLGTSAVTNRGAMAEVVAGDLTIQGVLQLEAGEGHTCALLVGGAVRCWGENDHGQCGIGSRTRHITTVGPDVDLPGPATAIDVGANHSCAILESGALYCWGEGLHGKLGLGDEEDVGATPSDIPSLRGPVRF